jgi:Domain of unknown function (DUF4384)
MTSLGVRIIFIGVAIYGTHAGLASLNASGAPTPQIATTSSARSSTASSQESWFIGEGSVPFGEDTTLGEAKARSRDHARRAAVEQAVGTFVESQTTVYNFQLAEDLIKATARGIIVEERIVEEGVRRVELDGVQVGLIYATKLRARVKRVHAERTKDLVIKASVNKSVFFDGEEMEVHLTPSRPVYVHIFAIDQEDSVTVLLPNRFVPSNLVQAPFVFPSEAHKTMGLRLRVFSPKASKRSVERLKIIATTKDVDLVKNKFSEALFRVYPGQHNGLAMELLKELSLLEDSEWAEATVAYEVR